jgi:hypothetical protein
LTRIDPYLADAPVRILKENGATAGLVILKLVHRANTAEDIGVKVGGDVSKDVTTKLHG